MITHNAAQIQGDDSLDEWLNELDPKDWLWARHAAGKADWIAPPRPLIESMRELLWQRVYR